MSIEDIVKHFESHEAPRPALGAPEVGAMRRIAIVPTVRATNEAKRTITFVSSTESTDRYGDIIRVEGWQTKNYMKNPVVLWAHRSTDPPIGRTVSLTTENNPPALVQTVEFADAKTYPFADQVYNLYRNGFLKSVSVGFRPLEQPTPIMDDTGRMTGFEFTSQELLELSCVPLPANPDAVARAVIEGVITRADAGKFFVEDDPVGTLKRALLRIEVEQLNLSVLGLQAQMLLRSLTAKGGADEITTIEELFATGEASETSINSLDQLDAALRGE